ncbi:MAG: DUF4288 domain-containing protein [Candidatus Acidiferrum sp.]
MKTGSKEMPWFWAWLVQITVMKNATKKTRVEGEVWKNLIIIKAANETEAMAKAMAIGRREEGDCDGTLRLNGKPATTKFLGIHNLGVIHEPVEDGAEILWELLRMTEEEAQLLVAEPVELAKSVKRELGK